MRLFFHSCLAELVQTVEILIQITILKFNSCIRNTMDDILGSWRSGFGSPETKRD